MVIELVGEVAGTDWVHDPDFEVGHAEMVVAAVVVEVMVEAMDGLQVPDYLPAMAPLVAMISQDQGTDVEDKEIDDLDRSWGLAVLDTVVDMEGSVLLPVALATLADHLGADSRQVLVQVADMVIDPASHSTVADFDTADPFVDCRDEVAVPIPVVAPDRDTIEAVAVVAVADHNYLGTDVLEADETVVGS